MNAIDLPGGRLIEIQPATLRDWLAADKAVLVDVREPGEFADERIDGSFSVPLSSFEPGAIPDPGGRRIVLVCAIGRRSRKAAELLHAAGHDEVVHLDGGLMAWDEAGLPIASAEAEMAGQAA